jgi:hypothetical protein
MFLCTKCYSTNVFPQIVIHSLNPLLQFNCPHLGCHRHSSCISILLCKLHSFWTITTIFQHSNTNEMHFLYSIYYELTASTCYEHYLLIFRIRCTNNTWCIACVLCLLATTRVGVELYTTINFVFLTFLKSLCTFIFVICFIRWVGLGSCLCTLYYIVLLITYSPIFLFMF